jgi:hypothetical protein
MMGVGRQEKAGAAWGEEEAPTMMPPWVVSGLGGCPKGRLLLQEGSRHLGVMGPLRAAWAA